MLESILTGMYVHVWDCSQYKVCVLLHCSSYRRIPPETQIFKVQYSNSQQGWEKANKKRNFPSFCGHLCFHLVKAFARNEDHLCTKRHMPKNAQLSQMGGRSAPARKNEEGASVVVIRHTSDARRMASSRTMEEALQLSGLLVGNIRERNCAVHLMEWPRHMPKAVKLFPFKAVHIFQTCSTNKRFFLSGNAASASTLRFFNTWKALFRKMFTARLYGATLKFRLHFWKPVEEGCVQTKVGAFKPHCL